MLGGVVSSHRIDSNQLSLDLSRLAGIREAKAAHVSKLLRIAGTTQKTAEAPAHGAGFVANGGSAGEKAGVIVVTASTRTYGLEQFAFDRSAEVGATCGRVKKAPVGLITRGLDGRDVPFFDLAAMDEERVTRDGVGHSTAVHVLCADVGNLDAGHMHSIRDMAQEAINLQERNE